MTQKSVNEEITGLEALEKLLAGKAVYDFYGCQYERIDNNIFYKYKKQSGQEYYVLCQTPLSTFINQNFKDKI